MQMPVLSNARHERFAQFLAQGKTATKAYELAGYKPNRWNAAFLARQDKIRERLTQINTELAKVTRITVEMLIAQNDEIRRRAMESRRYSAAIAAIREMGVLSGVRIERREAGGPGEFDHMSDEELERTMIEQFKRLFGPQLAIINGTITLNGVALVSPSDDHD